MSESKFDPMKEINRLTQSVGKAIEQGISSVQSTVERAATTSIIKLDIYEVDGMLIVQTNAIDGIIPDSIEINMEEDQLTIQCETQMEKTPVHASYYLQERKFGVLVRTVKVPVPVFSDEAKAKLKNGCLTITLPIDTDRARSMIEEMTE
jgi:HSP20 family protein